MPLPLIPVAIALVAGGGIGATSAADGIRRVRRAGSMHRAAVDRYEDARAEFEAGRDATRADLDTYGQHKLDVMAGGMSTFVTVFRRFKNVHLDESFADDAIPVGDVELGDLRDIDFAQWRAAKRAAGGAGVGAAAGTAAGGLSQLAIGSFATASSGAAISGLSGAAANSATLAWLGGGSVAAGGGGVATGGMILSAVAVAPALFVGGLVLWNRGDRALKDAEANVAEIDEAIAKMHAARTRFRAVGNLAARAHEALCQLDDRLWAEIDVLDPLSARERDYLELSRTDQERLAIAAALAVAIKALVDLPLINDRGNVRTRSREHISRLEREVDLV